MLKKISGEEVKKWTPLYSKYQNISIIILVGSFLNLYVVQALEGDLSVWIGPLLCLNTLLYLPTLLWEAKTGYLTSPLTIPLSFFKFKVRSVSRKSNPSLFWFCLLISIVLTVLFISLGIFAIAKAPFDVGFH